MDASPSSIPAIPMQDSLFTSTVVQIYVGQTMKLFHVHRGILSKSPTFQSQIFKTARGGSMKLPEISAPVFDLILQFLYGRQLYQWEDSLTTSADPRAPDENTLKPACELLSAALQYELAELKSTLTSYFLNTHNVSYRSILAAAKHVYTNAPIVEPWFKDLIDKRTREAMVADPGLVDKPWFMDVFEYGYGGLSRCLFECYRNLHRIPHGDASVPMSDKDKAIDLDRHGCCEQLGSPVADEDHDRDAEAFLELGVQPEAEPEPEPEPEPELEPELELEPEPEPEPTPLEDLKAWDEGLSVKDKKKKQKAMQLNGSWENRLTREEIDEMKAAAVARAEEAQEPESIPETEVLPELAPEPEPEPEPSPQEEGVSGGWGGSWGHSFRSGRKEEAAPVVPEPEPEPIPEPVAEAIPEPEPAPVEEEKKDDIWTFAAPATSKSGKKKKKGRMRKTDLFEEPVPDPGPVSELVLEFAPVVEDVWAQFGKSGKPEKTIEEALLFVPSHSSSEFSAKVEPEVAEIPPVDDFELEELDNGRTEPDKLSELSPVPDSAQEAVERSLCTNRRQHLREMARWQACPTCTREVVSMAISAAWA